MQKTAVLCGATGLTGAQLLQQIIAQQYHTRIIVITRRQIPQLPSHVEQVVIADFDTLAAQLTLQLVSQNLHGADAFCALGTTIKQAGSRAAFYQVDYSYVYDFARCMLDAGAHHFLLVSAQGAYARAPVFYSRVKGEIERDVAALAFDRVSIFRPSLLLGQRQQLRMGEHIFQRLMPWLKPILPKPICPIEAAQVAHAMLQVAAQPDQGARGVSYYSNQFMLAQ